MATNMQTGPGKRWNKVRVVAWALALALWLTPLVAMQFTREVDWTASDFVLFGAMLLFALGSYELLARMSPNRAYRAGVGVAIVGGFLLVWANLAVGIIGDGENLANLGFFAVMLVGMAGALLAWFQPAGMATAKPVSSSCST